MNKVNLIYLLNMSFFVARVAELIQEVRHDIARYRRIVYWKYESTK